MMATEQRYPPAPGFLSETEVEVGKQKIVLHLMDGLPHAPFFAYSPAEFGIKVIGYGETEADSVRRWIENYVIRHGV